MKIRLLQLDGTMPNIALMKLSTFHKNQGDDVDWYLHLADMEDTDILYISKLFDFTADTQYLPLNAEIIKGGTGYDVCSKLPEEVDKIRELDYSLYPECDYSMQFYSRGCINKCAFCVVPEKEGFLYADTPFKLNENGKHIEVLDNNFFASPQWEDACKHLIATKQPINFHGIQLETITQRKAEYINKMKLHKYIHIAWDDPKHDPRKKIKKITKWIKPYKFLCYVLIGFDSTPEEDLYRVEELRKLKIDPFVMPYDKTNEYQRKFARWCNHKAIFKTVKWEDYK